MQIVLEVQGVVVEGEMDLVAAEQIAGQFWLILLPIAWPNLFGQGFIPTFSIIGAFLPMSVTVKDVDVANSVSLVWLISTFLGGFIARDWKRGPKIVTNVAALVCLVFSIISYSSGLISMVDINILLQGDSDISNIVLTYQEHPLGLMGLYLGILSGGVYYLLLSSYLALEFAWIAIFISAYLFGGLLGYWIILSVVSAIGGGIGKSIFGD